MTDDFSSPSPDALREEEGTSFTLKGTARAAVEVEAVLHTVESPPALNATTARTNLYFYVPADRTLQEGAYRFEHERLPPFVARVERVEAGGRTPSRPGYRAVMNHPTDS